MRQKFLVPEIALAGALLVLLAIAFAAPSMPELPGQHDFADHRVLLGVPFAMDVLSSLAFLLAGVAGVLALRRVPRLLLFRAPRRMTALFFAGLLTSAVGSMIYHWHPDAAGLLVDRLGMSAAFAGLLGLAVAERVTDRAGGLLGIAVLVLAPVAAVVAFAAGNVLPWALAQFGGMLLVLTLAFVRPHPAALGVRLGWVIALYALAKLFELGDHAVFSLTGGWVSGHSLKHLLAALAAWPVIAALWGAARPVHNRRRRAGEPAGHDAQESAQKTVHENAQDDARQPADGARAVTPAPIGDHA